MSTWYEPKKEDISFSEDGKEMHVHFDQDYSGAIYISLQIKEVEDKLKVLKNQEKES